MAKNYTIPEGQRVYAVGDIHGYLGALERMLIEIGEDLHHKDVEATVVFIGDYIDRGPDSAGVIKTLIDYNARRDGIEKIFLKGNHEQAMLDFMAADDGYAGGWLQWGGVETMKSYRVRHYDRLDTAADIENARKRLVRKMPASHRDFLGKLRLSAGIGDYMFVHAGVNPYRPLDGQEDMEMMSIREPFLSWDEPMNKMIVHGHTITPDPDVRVHRINIDTGIYIGGPLSCAVLEGDDVRFIQVRGN